jgi:thioredoxin-related protein
VPPPGHTMKFLTPLFLAALLPAFAAGEDLWTTDLDAARKTAAEGKKDLLLSFTGSDWCPGCIMLKERIFSEAAFREGVKDQFVLVELDYPKNRTKLGEALVKRNELLLDQYFVAEFPTIILADELGRPYAQTSLSTYEPQGPADYVKHLTELRERRAIRDEALASAEKLEGLDRAKALQAAIAAFPDATVDAFYGEVVEKILVADPDDATGFREARDYRKAVADYEETIEQLFDEGKFVEAIKTADDFVAKNDPSGFERQHILMAKLMATVEIGTEAASLALLEEIKMIAPHSEIGIEAGRLKGRITAFFAEGKKALEPARVPDSEATPAPEGRTPGSEDLEKPTE